MPSASALRKFAISSRGRSIDNLRPGEKTILLYVAGTDFADGYDLALDEICARCQLPRDKAVKLIADLAERGYIRVDGEQLEVAKQ